MTKVEIKKLYGPLESTKELKSWFSSFIYMH